MEASCIKQDVSLNNIAKATNLWFLPIGKLYSLHSQLNAAEIVS